ncbi:MAG: hypothetical protein ACI9XC_001086 [Gammaproteobacteria bacterium]|jgi:hypothetical protein
MDEIKYDETGYRLYKSSKYVMNLPDHFPLKFNGEVGEVVY